MVSRLPLLIFGLLVFDLLCLHEVQELKLLIRFPTLSLNCLLSGFHSHGNVDKVRCLSQAQAESLLGLNFLANIRGKLRNHQ